MPAGVQRTPISMTCWLISRSLNTNCGLIKTASSRKDECQETEVAIFRSRQRLENVNTEFISENVQLLEKMTYLGLALDNTLSLKQHIRMICKRQLTTSSSSV